jgi:hypothetical protein
MNYNSAFDFNNAEASSPKGELIPDGTVARVILTIRPGGEGDGGWLKRSKAGDKLMIDAEFTVTEGPFAKRKFWQTMIVDGSEKAASINRSTLRAILESARGIKADDMSDNAKRARLVEGYGDFSGMEFLAKIGVEEGTGGYSDKNKLAYAIGVGSKEYKAAGAAGAAGAPVAAPGSFQPVGQVAANVVAQAAAAQSSKPSWAQ